MASIKNAMVKAPTSTALAKVPDEIDDPVIRAIMGDATVHMTPQSDPEQQFRDMMHRIYSATTAEEILSGSKLETTDRVLDQPIQLVAVDWRDSDFTESFGIYAILTVVVGQTGETMQVGCGAGDVMARVRRLETLGLLPVWVRLTKATKPTASGFFPLNITASSPDEF